MNWSAWTLVVSAVVPVVLASGSPDGAPARQGSAAPTRLEARRLIEKVTRIVDHGGRPRRGALQTIITEREVNAYFALDGSVDLPVGVTRATVVLHGDRRVAGSAVVDLDAVRGHHKPTGLFDPMSYLTGKLPVAAAGVLDARNGEARLQLESASIAGIPVPRAVLQEVIAYYTRSADYPKGIDIDRPFVLPAGITAIDVRRGEAVVVQ